MGDVMEYPCRIEDFIKKYSFRDKDEIYTNGSELIPVFRIVQAFDYYGTPRLGKWIEDTSSNHVMICSNCSQSINDEYSNLPYQFCPNCGSKMQG